MDVDQSLVYGLAQQQTSTTHVDTAGGLLLTLSQHCTGTTTHNCLEHPSSPLGYQKSTTYLLHSIHTRA